ncbi:MAG: hypothetical protein IKV61_00410 [Clostridia bacterium]|nr:hypothetical protein [Clostridia bacterium]
MQFTSLSIIFLIIMGLTIYRYAVKGYKKGLSSSIIEFAIILTCVFLSALIAIPIVDACSNLIIPYLVDSILGGSMGELGNYIEVVNILFKMVASLIFYVPIFVILKFIFKIIVAIIKNSKKYRVGDNNIDYYKEGEELYIRKQKAISAFIGALTGFAMFIITFSPLCGTLKTTCEIIDLANNVTEEKLINETSDIVSLKKYSNDFGVNLIASCGGESIFNMATSITVDGDYTNITQELNALKLINFEDINSIVGSIQQGDMASQEIKDLLNKVKKSKVLQVVLAETVKGISQAWLTNDEFMGIARPSLGDFTEIDSFINEILYVCTETDTKNVSKDLETLVNISGILMENLELFSSGDFDDVLAELSNNNLITQIKEELLKNSNMAPVAASIDGLIMKVVATEVQDFSKYSNEQREILYDDVVKIMQDTSSLTGSVKITSISSSIVECLNSYGITLPGGVSEKIAEQLASDLGAYGEDIDIGVVQRYFEAFIDSNQNIEDLIPQQ